MVAERLKEFVEQFGFGRSRLRSEWRVLLDLERPAAEQMGVDVQLAKEAIPAARVFLWDVPAVSLGFKQSSPAWLSSPGWAEAGFCCVERPTGGGIAVHGSDVSISVVVPRALEVSLDLLMRTVGGSTAQLCRSFGADAVSSLAGGNGERITYCLGESSPYAVTIGGRKVAGFALRRYSQSWLIQGSLLVRPVPAALTRVMDGQAAARLTERSGALSQVMREPATEAQVARRWADHWTSWWDELLVEELAEIAS